MTDVETAAAAPTETAEKPAPKEHKGPGKKKAKKSPAERVAKKAAAQPSKPEPEISVGTDAAFADPEPGGGAERPIRNISDVRHFFRTNERPIYFFGATPFNLMGLDRWVRNFHYITYYDGWDGAHPRVFSPRIKATHEFQSGEEINNWLLTNPEVRAQVDARRKPGVRPMIAMVFFDEETERICEELGYDLILPKAALREHLDSKIVTTQLGNEAGAPSVPNILTTADTFDELMEKSVAAGLGTDLVVQTPYGDSGKTTFFIDEEADWNANRENIVGEQLKVMKRINNLPLAVEAVITSSGTIVGPFLSELTGHPELTPYRGGWCGNEMHGAVLDPDLRLTASDLVRRMGDRLGQEGYRGFFEIDVLIDTDTREVYLGELNPRISGASAITHVTAGAYADVPLFLFHLLEYMHPDFKLDTREINVRWQELAAGDSWSHMIVKEINPAVEAIWAAPATGQYYIDATGALVYRRAALDWHQLQNENEVFFLRIYGAGDYRWKGADLGVIVTKGRLQRETADGSTLTIRAKHLVNSIRSLYGGTPIAGTPVQPTAIKSL